MAPGDLCGVCSDNFIVSSKFLNCSYCQGPYHPHCAKVKDAVLKAIQDAGSIFWYCDTCKPIVMDKLSGNLLTSSDRAVTPTTPDTPSALLPECNRIISEALSLKYAEWQAANVSFRNDLSDQLGDLKREIGILRDTNVDMVRLLTGSPCSRRVIPHGDNVPCKNIALSTSSLSGSVMVEDGHARPDTYRESTFGVPVPLPMNASPGKSYPKKITADGVDDGVSGPGIKSVIPHNGEPGVIRSQRKPAYVRGSGGASDVLKPAPKGRNWIWVGGLAKDTTVDDIGLHLKDHFGAHEILTYDLKSKFKKSFKVGSADLSVQELLNPKLWPDGILVKPFLSRPKRQ